MTKFVIRTGEHALQPEHCVLAKQSPYTRDFSNQMMFSGPEHYARGWIRVAYRGSRLVGLTCVRHKTRLPQTVLYFLIVDQECRRSGLGRQLLSDMYRRSPHQEFALNCMKDNEAALKFYRQDGWKVTGESLGGSAWAMGRVLRK